MRFELRFGCVVAAVMAGWAAPPAAEDPPQYGRMYLYQAASGAMEPLPVEPVHQRSGRGGAEAWIEGERSKMRLKAGQAPVLVIAYRAGLPPEWAARAYRFRVENGRRVVRLDVRKVAPNGQTLEGQLAVKMEPHGRLSVRLVLPTPLAPGEYGVSTPGGRRAFTFGIDP
ncbi:MAG: hypothetical protein ACP5VC_18045 [Bryobacteraceae bacterium]